MIPFESDDIRRTYEHPRVRGMAAYKPRGKRAALLADIKSAIADLSEGGLKPIGRQILYRLVGAYDYSKKDEASVQEVLNRARRAGYIPWGAVGDGRAQNDGPFEFEDEAEFWGWAAQQARRIQLPRQEGQDQYIELWTEAAGLIPQLAAIGHPFGVPVYSCSGFDTSGARLHAGARAAGRSIPTVILHIGDHDTDGVSVFNSFYEDVQAFAAAYGNPGTVEVIRAAILPSQIRKYNKPQQKTEPRKKLRKDGSVNGQRGGKDGEVLYASQVESLTTQELATEITAAITPLITGQLLEATKQDEPALRTSILDRIDDLIGGTQ